MENILLMIIQWLVPFACAGAFAFISKQLKDNNQANKAMRESMIILLRSQIVGKAENYIELGYLPDYARSCMEDLFKQYESLGGNHGVGSLVEQCYELPPVKKGR